jgi:hypothetical protein
LLGRCGDERLLAAGFVGVEAVVADGLFSLGREVVDDGGDEVGSFEDLEVALSGVVFFLVGGEECFPSGREGLPEWGGAGPAGLVDGWHKECS